VLLGKQSDLGGYAWSDGWLWDAVQDILAGADLAPYLQTVHLWSIHEEADPQAGKWVPAVEDAFRLVLEAATSGDPLAFIDECGNFGDGARWDDRAIGYARKFYELVWYREWLSEPFRASLPAPPARAKPLVPQLPPPALVSEGRVSQPSHIRDIMIKATSGKGRPRLEETRAFWDTTDQAISYKDKNLRASWDQTAASLGIPPDRLEAWMERRRDLDNRGLGRTSFGF
jgi:hypothetical protein